MFTLKSKAGHCWLSLFQTLLEQTVTYVHKMSLSQPMYRRVSTLYQPSSSPQSR